MATCNNCNGTGRVVVKDDVWKHLTGRGKPAKTKKCPACGGRGKQKARGWGCLWMLVSLGAILFFLLSIQSG